MTKTWYQQALTPPTVIEVTLKVGVIPTEDHAQAWIELQDPTTSVVIAQWSAPHSSLHGLAELLDLSRRKLGEMLDQACEPF